MALVTLNGPAFPITATNTYVLGDADNGAVSTWAIHIVATGFTGTVIPKARSRSIGGISVTTPAFLEIPYLPLVLNGSVGTYGTGSAVDITDTSIILVQASGLSIALDCTVAAGSLTVYAVPCLGAAA